MLELKSKQKLVIDALNDPTVNTIVLIGAVGTGKTDVAAHAVISICDTFPKTYWPVFRMNLSTAKRSVVLSYLAMLDKMNFVQGQDFKFNGQDTEIIFPNGSRIPFLEADHTKDRQGRKIKGINASGNHIDEADELEQTMFITANSRRGRRNETGQPSLSIVTMNPNDTHLKELYYDPYRAGTLPAATKVIEFDLADSWQTPEDIAALKTNPKWWTERYLFNNWEYADESTSLFKSRAWAASLTDKLDGAADRSAGYDVARTGNDRSTRCLLYGGTVADIAIVKAKDEQMRTDEQADWLIKDAGENSYGIEKTAIDAVGLGAGMVDSVSKQGFHAVEYMSGAAPDSNIKLADDDNVPINFDNLRSQMIYLYARGIELGIIKHFSGCPYLNELQKEAMLHNYEVTDKVLRIESKEKIKKRLGASPDILDCVVMALYIRLKRQRVTFRVRTA